MAGFLFWNVRGNSRPDLVADLANEHSADFLILAEPPKELAKFASSLNERTKRPFVHPFSQVEDPLLLTTFPRQWVETLIDDGNVSIRRVVPPLGLPYLLVIAHLGSRKNRRPEDLGFLVTRLALRIREVEASEGHARTVVVGDLNMDPFELGIVNSEGLHAIADRRVAQQKARVVARVDRPFFYNPTWNLMGDGQGRTPGTYFYNSGNPVNYYWHTFDQVLLRADLVGFFEEASLQVISSTNQESLITKNGRPRAECSDHLPITFRLSVERS